jgi:hypothetical protein
MMYKFAHIINPVVVGPVSDLFKAQPITFETMKVAREVAERQNVSVQLYTAQYSEDKVIIPDYFTLTPDLASSVLDYGSFIVKRKLPLIKDILDRLYIASEGADYLIYTNVDIALVPNFYITVNQLIEQGYDSFTVNRRTIPNNYKLVEDIPLMIAEIGKSHPGTDCFIIKKSYYEHYYLDKTCIGTLHIAKSLMINMISTANNFKVFDKLHLTFHIGDDRAWGSTNLSDYVKHNEDCIHGILKHLRNDEELMSNSKIDKYSKQFDFVFWSQNQSVFIVVFEKMKKTLKKIIPNKMFRKIQELYVN